MVFGYVMVEQSLSWYEELLNLALPDSAPLRLSQRTVLGTVIAITGSRRYFNVFQSSHRMGPLRRQLRCRNQER